MERESFESQRIAQLLNERFVSIKVFIYVCAYNSRSNLKTKNKCQSSLAACFNACDDNRWIARSAPTSTPCTCSSSRRRRAGVRRLVVDLLVPRVANQDLHTNLTDSWSDHT